MSPEATRLVEDNIYLPRYIANKYMPRTPLEPEDLIQEGMIGLVCAARGFDPDRGVKFSTFAARCILSKMRVAVRKTRKKRSIPDSAKVYLDAPSTDTNDIFISEIIPDTNVDVEAEVVRMLELATVETLIDTLPSAERRALQMYAYDGLKQREIACILGIHQTHASRLIRKARSRLTKRLGGERNAVLSYLP